MFSPSARALRTCLAAAVCFVLVAVSIGSAIASDPLSPQASTFPDLHVGVLQGVDSLNPYIGFSDTSYMLYGLLYDYLFSLDQDGNYVPNLAVSASCDAVCMNWTYQIRQGVLWSDGTALTADDVAFTIDYDSQNLFQLWAYEPYMNQVVQCSSATKPYCGAAVTSPWNVTVYFQRPFVAGRALFMPIVQKAQWSAVSPQQAETTFQNANPIGTGPFIADPNIYTEWQQQYGPGVALHVYRNVNYHPVGTHTGSASLTDIYIHIFVDQNTLALNLMSGTIDLAQMTFAGVQTVHGYPNIETQSALQAIQYWNEIGFSQIDTASADGRLNPARWDARVRVALAHTTNRDFIVNTIYHGQGVRGTSLMSPITPQWWYDPVAGGDNVTFDVSQANAILDASGYTTWSGGSLGNGYRMASQPISLSVEPACYQCLDPPNVTKTIPAGTPLVFTLAVRPPSQFPEELVTAQYLQAQYAQVGVQINIKIETTEMALASDVYSGYVEMYIWYWSGDPDPNYLLSMESSWTLDGWNDNYWNNGTYNHDYLAHLADLDVTSRIAAVHAAQKVNYESAAYIVYIYPYGQWAMRTDRLQNWGDWAAHPYRQMTTFWGANPLFLELVPVGPPNNPPSTPIIQGTSPLLVQANQNVTFTGSSTDPDPNETLTWTWSWGDGSQAVVTTTSAVQSVTTYHTWAVPGVYLVYLTVSDGQLSAASAGFQVNVQGVTLANAYGQPGQPTTLHGAIVETTKGKWTLAFGDGSSASGSFPAGGANLDVSHTYLAEGTYAATLTAKMGSLTVSTGASVIIDGTPPVLTVPAHLYVEATGNLTPVFFNVTATDNVGLLYGPACFPSSGTAFPLGTFTVYCYAQDLAGNLAQATFDVTVRDTTAPVLFVSPFVDAEATSAAGAYVTFSVSASDNVAIASGPSCTPASGSAFPLGSTSVLCSAADTSGNVGYANFTVLVRDTTPPFTNVSLAVDGNGYVIYPGGVTPSSAMTFQVAAFDAVGVVGLRCSLDGAAFAPCSGPVTVSGLTAGVHTFSVGGIDAAGNFAPVSFTWAVLTPTGTVQDLINKVNALQAAGKLTAKQANALLTPLNRALTDIQAGKISFAIKELKSFRSLLSQDVSNGILSLVDAQPLLDEAADLILVLGGTP